MSKRFRVGVAGLTVGAVALAWAFAGASAAKDDKKDAGQDVFGLAKVLHFDLQIDAKEWDKMQPPPGRGFPGGPGGFPGGPGGFPGGPAVPEKPAQKNTDVHKGSGFGLEFPWVHGDLTAEGKTYKALGFRFKGNASYMASARGLKRNFKIELDHYNTNLRFHGLKSLNLNAGAMDPSKARESLSFAVFRAAGVPAPRTAYAEVTLTIPGKYDKEYLGLYTFIEQVDRTFLKDHFKNGKGLLMKPEGVRGIDYLGDNWDSYKARYRPKHDPSKKEAQRLIDFAKLIHKAGDEQFRKEIASYLDVDEFLRFLAANAMLSNLDSLLVLGHNFYIYLNPETNKFVFIPWDMDLSLAGFPMAGGPEQQMDLSLNHPHAGENKLIDRLLAMKDVNTRYQKLLKELAATCFTKEALLKDIDAIEKATKEITAREKKAAEARKEGAGGFGFGPPGGGMFGRSIDPRTFVARRTDSILAQLDGKSKGYVPAMGFGPGGPGGFGPPMFGPPPQPGQVLEQNLQNQLKLTAEQKKQLDELQKDVDGRLRKILTDEQKKQLKEIRERGRFGPGGFGPGGFGPPGGGNPGGRPGSEEPKKEEKKP